MDEQHGVHKESTNTEKFNLVTFIRKCISYLIKSTLFGLVLSFFLITVFPNKFPPTMTNFFGLVVITVMIVFFGWFGYYLNKIKITAIAIIFNLSHAITRSKDGSMSITKTLILYTLIIYGFYKLFVFIKYLA